MKKMQKNLKKEIENVFNNIKISDEEWNRWEKEIHFKGELIDNFLNMFEFLINILKATTYLFPMAKTKKNQKEV